MKTTAATRSVCACCAFWWLVVSVAAETETTGSPNHQGFDEAAGVIRNGAWRAGMPLGGIGCGKFELLPSGWFARFTWNHNWDLPTWENPFVPSRGAFFAITVRDGATRVTRWLRRGWPEEELKDVEQVRLVESRMVFPFADIAFSDPKLPVRAGLRAWSPLVPHNVKDSSLPVAFFEMSLENPTERPMEASVLASLENYIGIGGVRVHEGKQRWYFCDRSRQQPVVISGSVLQGLKFVTPHRFDGIGRNVAGEYLLLTDGPTTDRGWDALGDGSELVGDFRTDGELNGLQAASREDKARSAGALCRKMRLGPGEKQTLHFVVVWWTPSHVTLDLKDHGHYHLESFRDSEKLAAYVFDQRARLLRETEEWARLVRESSLPAWLQRLALNAAAALFSNTVLTRDGRFAVQENPGAGEGALGALEHHETGSALIRALFPELDRKEMEMFRACQQPSGELPRLCGNVYRGIGATNAWRAVTGAPEPAIVFIREVFRHFRATGDRQFLDDSMPAVKRARRWLATLQRDAPSDGDEPAPIFLNGDFQAARRAHDFVYRYHKNPWGLPAAVLRSFADPPRNGESHRNGPAMWTLLAAAAGVDVDAPKHRLIVRPVGLGTAAGAAEIHAPVFLPRFWARLDHGPDQFRLRILKHFGEPLEIRELAPGERSKPIELPKPFAAVAGASLDLAPWRGQLRPSRSETRPTATRVAREELHWSRGGVGTLLWSATASSEEPYTPADAFDGYRPTRWQTLTPLRTSDWFKLDLGELRDVRRIELQMNQAVTLSIQGSRDGRAWQPIGSLSGEAAAGLRWWAADLPPKTAVRFLKLSPAADGDVPWSIHEMRME